MPIRSEEHTSELQSLRHLVCRLLLEKKKQKNKSSIGATYRPGAGFANAGGITMSPPTIGVHQPPMGACYVLVFAFFFFFFNDTATTEIYTLSLHDALPICAAPFSRAICSIIRNASGAS